MNLIEYDNNLFILYRLIYQINEKNLLPKKSKMRKKKPVSKYYVSSHMGTIRMIPNQSFKNFVILWDIEKENK